MQRRSVANVLLFYYIYIKVIWAMHKSRRQMKAKVLSCYLAKVEERGVEYAQNIST